MRSLRIRLVSFDERRSTISMWMDRAGDSRRTLMPSPSKVSSTGTPPKAQAWSIRPQEDPVSSSPRYAKSISSSIVRPRSCTRLNALAVRTQMAAEDESPFLKGSVRLVTSSLSPSPGNRSRTREATPAE